MKFKLTQNHKQELILPLLLCVQVCRAQEMTPADLSEPALDQRIEQLRKGDFAVVLRDSGGKPVTGEVAYTLIRHAFPLGTAVSAKYLLADPKINPDAARYQDILKSHFNCAVAENAHKWYCMEKNPGVCLDDEALQVWQRCRELGLPMRGHCIFWGVRQGGMPAWIKALPPRELEPAMKARLRRVLALFDGKINEWDLNNEMMHDDYFAQTLGWKNGSPYFTWAMDVAPQNTYYVNEYDVLQGNQVDRYVAHIKALQAAGAKVGGIGDQAHFMGGTVPPNDQLWAILNKLGQFGLPVKITEFDINTKDEARQAVDTRRFYKLCFAHPAVSGIMMWGFWEGSHWITNAALWRRDWSIKPNGTAYLKLLDEWHTQGTAPVDRQGQLQFRGFYGDYQIRQGTTSWRVSLGKDHTHQNGRLQDD